MDPSCFRVIITPFSRHLAVVPASLEAGSCPGDAGVDRPARILALTLGTVVTNAANEKN